MWNGARNNIETRTSLFDASPAKKSHTRIYKDSDDPKTILAAHSVRSVGREESIESAERIHFPVAAPDNERAS